jgi:cystathionine beta-lyase/cystathionine gamma-synthase
MSSPRQRSPEDMMHELLGAATCILMVSGMFAIIALVAVLA